MGRTTNIMTSQYLTLSLFLLLLAPLPALCDRSLYIVNKCPGTMSVTVGTTSIGTIAAGGSRTHNVPDNFSGSVKTDNGAPGGTPPDSVGNLEAGFVMQSFNYYFLVQKPGPLYVGISIRPQYQPYEGYCKTATCNAQTCTNTYSSFPMKLPPIVPKNPDPPFYACPGNSVAYTIELCPTGNLLNPNTGIAIHPNGNNNKCLDVRGASFKNGTPVQMTRFGVYYDCNNTPAQKWVLRRGKTSIQVAGTNFCLDSSTNPASGNKMKIWQCHPGIPAQTWSFDSLSNYIARLGADQCLDLPNGVLRNSNVVQTWRCSNDNKNQVWTV